MLDIFFFKKGQNKLFTQCWRGHVFLNPIPLWKWKWKRVALWKWKSDCLRANGLYSPWNSPGQNTGVEPFPSLGDLPNPGIEPGSPALQADSLPTELWGKPHLSGWWSSKQLVVLCVSQGEEQTHIAGGGSGVRIDTVARERHTGNVSWNEDA